MGWTAPRTWTNGEVGTAALFNAQIRDNVLALGGTYRASTASYDGATTAWQAFTPGTVSPSGLVVQDASYTTIGRTCFVRCTAVLSGGTGQYAIGYGSLPQPLTTDVPVGAAHLWIFSGGSGKQYCCTAVFDNTLQAFIFIVGNGVNQALTTTNPAASAGGDTISFTAVYEF